MLETRPDLRVTLFRPPESTGFRSRAVRPPKLTSVVLVCLALIPNGRRPVFADEPAFQIPAEVIRLAADAAAAELAQRGDLSIRRPVGLENLDSTDAIKRAAQQAVSELAAPEFDNEATQRLRYLGKQAYFELVRALQSDDPRIRRRSAVCLERHGEMAIVPLSSLLASDPEASVRATAAQILGNTHHPEAAHALIKAFKDDDASVRNAAVHAVKYTRDPEAIKPLSRLTGDPGIGRVARSSLAHIREPQGYAVWPPGLLEVRQLAINAETLAGEKYAASEIESLLHHIDCPEWAVSTRCLLALSQLDARKAVPEIIQRCSDREVKFQVLARLATPESFYHLMSLLHSSDRNARRAAIGGLGNGGGRWAVPVLVALLDDRSLRTQHQGPAQPIDAFGGRWPDQHAAHSTLRQCLHRAGLHGNSLNLATGAKFDLDTEIQSVRKWWGNHGAAFLRGDDVPNPELTSVSLDT